VFGVFTLKDKLPTAIKNALPGYYFSQNLKEATEALQKAAYTQGTSILGVYGSSTTGYALLFSVNGLMLVGVVALIRRRRRALSPQSQPLLV
jgi:hypothetical protein